MVMVVFGDDIVKWAYERLPGEIPFDRPIGIGILSGKGVLKGAFVLDGHNRRSRSITLSIAVEDKKMCTWGVLEWMADYIYNTLGCERLVCNVSSENLASQKLCRKFGFKLEGVLRGESATPGADLMIYGMLKEECHWWSDRDG